MKLLCKSEFRCDDGKKEKIMNFTKGLHYYALESDDGVWEIKDDNGEIEEFWNLELMFILLK